MYATRLLGNPHGTTLDRVRHLYDEIEQQMIELFDTLELFRD